MEVLTAEQGAGGVADSSPVKVKGAPTSVLTVDARNADSANVSPLPLKCSSGWAAAVGNLRVTADASAAAPMAASHALPIGEALAAVAVGASALTPTKSSCEATEAGDSAASMPTSKLASLAPSSVSTSAPIPKSTKEALEVSFPRCSVCKTSWYDAVTDSIDEEATKPAAAARKRKLRRERPSHLVLFPMPECACRTRLALPGLPLAISSAAEDQYCRDDDPLTILSRIETHTFPNLAMCGSCLRQRIAASKEVTVHDYRQEHIQNGQRNVKFTVEPDCVRCRRRFRGRELEKLLESGGVRSKNLWAVKKKQGKRQPDWFEAVASTIELVGWAKRVIRWNRRRAYRLKSVQGKGVMGDEEYECWWGDHGGFTGGNGSSDECYSLSSESGDEWLSDNYQRPSKGPRRIELRPGELWEEFLKRDPIFKQEKDDEEFVKKLVQEEEEGRRAADARAHDADKEYAKKLEKEDEQRERRRAAQARKCEADEQLAKKFEEEEEERARQKAAQGRATDEQFAKKLVEEEREKQRAAEARISKDHELAMRLYHEFNVKDKSSPAQTSSRGVLFDAFKKTPPASAKTAGGKVSPSDLSNSDVPGPSSDSTSAQSSCVELSSRESSVMLSKSSLGAPVSSSKSKPLAPMRPNGKITNAFKTTPPASARKVGENESPSDHSDSDGPGPLSDSISAPSSCAALCSGKSSITLSKSSPVAFVASSKLTPPTPIRSKGTIINTFKKTPPASAKRAGRKGNPFDCFDGDGSGPLSDSTSAQSSCFELSSGESSVTYLKSSPGASVASCKSMPLALVRSKGTIINAFKKTPPASAKKAGGKGCPSDRVDSDGSGPLSDLTFAQSSCVDLSSGKSSITLSKSSPRAFVESSKPKPPPAKRTPRKRPPAVKSNVGGALWKNRASPPITAGSWHSTSSHHGEFSPGKTSSKSPHKRTTSPLNADVVALVDMGFSESAAQKCLRIAKGDAAAAVTMLLDEAAARFR